MIDRRKSAGTSLLLDSRNHALQTNTYLRRIDDRATSGKPVVLNGWVDAYRDFGGLVFIDLRDRYGVTQVVFEPDAGKELQARGSELRNEYVVGIKGTVAPRLHGKENPKLKTGGIEVRVQEMVVYNATPTPPFEMHGPDPNEELRLTYRYLDLRRPDKQAIFILRHRLAQLMRNTMSELGFLEVETPDPGPQHARGRTRLPGPQPGSCRPFLCACRSRRRFTSSS